MSKGVPAELSHSDIKVWVDNFSWMKLGREICQCRLFRTEDFCEDFKLKHKVECLEYKSGPRLVVKQFNKDEVQTMYNPTPGRGLAFIRVFRGQERQEWRRKRSGEITVKDYDKTFHIGENATTICTTVENCRLTEASVNIYDGKFLWLSY